MAVNGQQSANGSNKNSAISDSLLSDVTCSLCLGLFEKPKTLPSCPHSFCLECLTKLALKSSEPISDNTIRCPECRAVNKLPSNLSDLITNIVAQNIVEKIKKQQSALKTSNDATHLDDECPHYLLGESRDLCAHCQAYFCNACKYRHMDAIKESLIELSMTDEDVSSAPSVDGIDRLFQDRISTDDETLKTFQDDISARIQEVLSAQLLDVRTAAQNVQLDVKKQVNQVTEQLAGVRDQTASIKQRKDRLLASSIFRHSLEDVAKLYIDAKKANEAICAAKAMATTLESPLLQLAVTPDYDSLLKRLLDSTIAELKVPSNVASFVKTVPPKPSARVAIFCSKDVQTEPVEFVVEKRDTFEDLLAAALRSALTKYSGVWKKYQSEQAFTFKNRPLRIVALPTQEEYAVAIIGTGGSTYIGFCDVVGEFKCAGFTILRPAGYRRLHVKDLATDYRSTIFFTAYVVDGDGVASKRIYRIWRNTHNPNYPDLFATSTYETDLDQQFNGIAISPETRLVLTTEGLFVVAYESINTLRGELADRVKVWYVGPSPCLLGVSDGSGDGSVQLIVSTDDHTVVKTKTVYPNDEERESEEDDIVWKMKDGQGKAIKLGDSGHFAFHRGYALVHSNSEIHRFGDVLDEPIYLGKYPSCIDTNDGGEMKSMALLINRSADDGAEGASASTWKSHVAILDNKKGITYAEMADD